MKDPARPIRPSRIVAVGRIDRLELWRRRSILILLVLLPTGGAVARAATRLRLQAAGWNLPPIDPATALFEPLLWSLIGAGALPFELRSAGPPRTGWDSYLSAGLSRAELVCGRALVPAVTGLGTGLLVGLARRIEPGAMRFGLSGLLPPLIGFAVFAGLLAVFGSIRTETAIGFGLVFGLIGGGTALGIGRLTSVAIDRPVPATWLACAVLLAGSWILFRDCERMLRKGGQ